MLNRNATEVSRNRSDLSRFMVHLTRDNRADFDEGFNARKSFIKIWNGLKIRARRSHCLHQRYIRKQPVDFRRKFAVACFTETPLSQIQQLIDIPGRQINLEPYGFVFTREFLVRMKGGPVHYINRYADEEKTKAADRIFWTAVENDCKDPSWRFVPFWSAMDEGCDFAWEREWRVKAAVRFRRSDLVCVVLPEGDGLWGTMNRNGVAAISAEWTPDEIVEGMARQLRKMHKARQAS